MVWYMVYMVYSYEKIKNKNYNDHCIVNVYQYNTTMYVFLNLHIIQGADQKYF